MQRRAFLITALTSVGALPLLTRQTLALAKPAAAGFVIRAGQSRFGIPTPFRGLNPNDLKISARDTGGALALFEYVGMEQAGPSLHLHLAQDEIFYVAEGEFLFQLGDQKQLLGAGDTIFLPRQLPHSWVQRSTRGRLLYWLQPAGRLEEYFVVMSRQKARLPADEMARLYAAYGLRGLGPGLSATEAYAVSPHLDSGFVVAAGTGRLGEQIRLGGHSPTDLKVAAQDTGGAFSLWEYTGHEKGGPPLHVHPHQDEAFYVLTGTYRFRVGKAEHELMAGDLIFLPRNVPHTFAQLTESGRLLCFFQPAGRMEDFFREAARFRAPPTPKQAARLFADHGMRVVGPPLAY
ncbi:MAG: cupin domain-containing protein [Hymenobacter sp.]|nr:cupin domain-containing protein [Hymenobacter sp.]